MNRNTILIILRFAVVILIIALALFFITDVNAPSFIALSITMVFCTFVFVFGIFSLTRDKMHPLTKKQTVISLSVYSGVMLVSILIKVLIAIYPPA